MARITVEDCLVKMNNRFKLVLMAAKRARKLVSGSVEPYLEWENDKPTVMALREIAAGYLLDGDTSSSKNSDKTEEEPILPVLGNSKESEESSISTSTSAE